MLITGIGSLSGEDPIAAAQLVYDLFPELPFLPELPECGVGSDFAGKSATLLHDLHFDLQPAGWRLTDRAGAEERRAKGAFARNLDAFHEVFDEFEGRIKVQLAGPLTLAVLLETSRAGSVLGDLSATKDVAQSLAHGVNLLVTDLKRRLPGVISVVVQLDEPLLTKVLRGEVKTASGFGRIRIPEAEEVLALFAEFDQGNDLVLHSCEASLPIEILTRSAIRTLSLDAALVERREYEALAEFHDRGKQIWLGVIGGVDRPLPPVSTTVTFVQNLMRDIGLPLEDVALTHSCGLPHSSYQYANSSTMHLRNVVAELVERSG